MLLYVVFAGHINFFKSYDYVVSNTITYIK